MPAIVTLEGRNFSQRLLFKQGIVPAAWYIAPFESAYTPTDALTAATFPGLATECVSYEASTRALYVPSDVVAGGTNNNAELAAFEMTADKTIYGYVLVTAPAKGGTGGVLYSAIRLAVPQEVSAGSLLRVRASTLAISPV